MSTTGPLNPEQLTRGKTLNEFCVGPRLYENSKVRSAKNDILELYFTIECACDVDAENDL